MLIKQLLDQKMNKFIDLFLFFLAFLNVKSKEMTMITNQTRYDWHKFVTQLSYSCDIVVTQLSCKMQLSCSCHAVVTQLSCSCHFHYFIFESQFLRLPLNIGFQNDKKDNLKSGFKFISFFCQFLQSSFQT